MPSIAAYTPYETLKLCQSVAQQGTDALDFQETAAALDANTLIREADSYDASRLTADALHGLFDDLVKQETAPGSPKINGDAPAEPANPRKRKSPASPLPNREHDAPSEGEGALQALVAKLYTRFREDAIKEIRRDEDEYAKLQKEIDELEQHVAVAAAPAPPAELQKPLPTVTPHRREGSKTDISALLTYDDDNNNNNHDSMTRTHRDEQTQGLQTQTAAVPSAPLSLPPPPAHHQQALSSQQPSPATFQRQLPPPSPQRSQFPQPPAQHGFVPSSAGHQVPIHPPTGIHVQHMPLPMEHATQKRASATSTPTRNSPVPPQHQYPQPYPGYPPYQQPPPHWQPQYPQPAYPQQHIRGRPQSMTPSASVAVKSRSQSAVSHRSDTPSERPSTIKRGSQKIKTEAPSTPVPDSRGVDLIEPAASSAGRTRGRLRNNDLSSTPSAPATAARPEVTRTGTVKRKHPSTDQDSLSPAAPSPTPTTRSTMYTTHPRFLVLVSKNFAKTSQLVLNEIQSHKLAGIFAKPLTQREAPGYKDLIFRPMDLKTLRAAVTKGNTHERGKEKEIGNGFWLVRQTDDLVPPKGIVNAAQFEMELARMFANAVMFNPLPTSERGFGKALRLRSEGDGVEGIIADAREMFEDAMTKVSEWRRVEGETMGAIERTGNDGGQDRSRSTSVDAQLHRENDASAALAPAPEGEAGVERRKRRRVGD
ncbi:hypothetical protein DV737_g3467, partial [Chaetothyriales sp. CBS 132003]